MTAGRNGRALMIGFGGGFYYYCCAGIKGGCYRRGGATKVGAVCESPSVDAGGS